VVFLAYKKLIQINFSSVLKQILQKVLIVLMNQLGTVVAIDSWNYCHICWLV